MGKDTIKKCPYRGLADLIHIVNKQPIYRFRAGGFLAMGSYFETKEQAIKIALTVKPLILKP